MKDVCTNWSNVQYICNLQKNKRFNVHRASFFLDHFSCKTKITLRYSARQISYRYGLNVFQCVFGFRNSGDLYIFYSGFIQQLAALIK